MLRLVRVAAFHFIPLFRKNITPQIAAPAFMGSVDNRLSLLFVRALREEAAQRIYPVGKA